MKITLLIDLDDTLIENPIEVFISQYFHLFGDYVKDLVDPKLFVSAILAGTDAMNKARNPSITLEETFQSVFFPMIKVKPESILDRIDGFYQEVFPQLKPICSPIPGAQQFITEAKARDLPMVVATNPIFPKTAIMQRIEWAELPAEIADFKWVSHYEESHFSKPSASYYAECLARLHWPQQPAVMIGNDPISDIAGAERLGLPAYLVKEKRTSIKALSTRSAEGPIAQFFDWLDYMPIDSLLPKYNHYHGIQAVLRGTLASIDHSIRKLSVTEQKILDKQKKLQARLAELESLGESASELENFFEILVDSGIFS